MKLVTALPALACLCAGHSVSHPRLLRDRGSPYDPSSSTPGNRHSLSHPRALRDRASPSGSASGSPGNASDGYVVYGDEIGTDFTLPWMTRSWGDLMEPPTVIAPKSYEDLTSPEPRIQIFQGFLTHAKESFENLSPYYLPNPKLSGVSPDCARDVERMGPAIPIVGDLPRWSKIMVDSWGKSDDGMRYGMVYTNYIFPGVMDECLGVYVTVEEPVIEGQYCMVDTAFTILPKRYGTCIPSSCTEDDLLVSVVHTFNESKWYPAAAATTVECQMTQFVPYWGTWEIVGSSIIGFFLLLVIAATIVDLLMPDSINKGLKSFSAASNLEKIFAVNVGGTRGEITCFHGIRVLSILWVILGHQFATMFYVISDMKHIYEMSTGWGFQIIASGLRAVDTFFLLGGILLSRSLLKTDFCIQGKRKLKRDDNDTPRVLQEEVDSSDHLGDLSTWSQIRRQGSVTTITTFLGKYFFYIFIRIVRMLPGMFLTIMFFAGPVTLLLSGPLRFTYEEFYLEPCRKNWWMDLTFVVNFIQRATFYDGGSAMSCVGNSWYISVDMQIYLIMPFLLLPVKIMKYKQAYLWLLVGVSCAIPSAIVMAGDLLPTNLLGAPMEEINEYMFRVYLMPWTRATPYFVGALVGFWLLKLENSEKTGRELMTEFYKKHPRIAALYPRLLGWLLNTAVALAVVFGLVESQYYSIFQPKVAAPHVLTPAETFFYIALAIFAWSVVVSWVIMQCVMGLAEPLNFLLSHPMWQPLSRLTFGAYLISYPLQYMIYSTFQEYIYINWNMILMLWMGMVWLSYAASLALSLLIEAPVIGLLKLIRK